MPPTTPWTSTPTSTPVAEYIWLGGSGHDLRSKSRTLDAVPASLADLPDWNFDGSSTGQAAGDDSEVVLKPRAMYTDPFRGAPHLLVLCDCHTPAGAPLDGNTRVACADVMARAADEAPWFGIEQEYTLFERDGMTPHGWPVGGFPGPQGPYYCGVGTEHVYGRSVMDDHYRVCLAAGLRISGTNAEVMPGQWEYQVGPCVGIEAGDALWLSRYLMLRVCERHQLRVSFDPKPIPGDWNGAGCHTNYSTNRTRDASTGWVTIQQHMAKLEAAHDAHIAVYGEGNDRRLTGAHETAPITKFSYGVADRGASVRIPRATEAAGCGYYEDRRPASNMDPYVVTRKLVETTVLEE